MKRIRRIISLALMFTVIAGSLIMDSALAYSKPYYIEVDITNQIVTVYNTEDNSIARQMICSSGKNDATPLGVFYLPKKDRDDERSEWYNFYVLHVYAKWATRIRNGYMFHSIPCREPKESAVVKSYQKALGTPDSHGCVRMRTDDAKFIAKKCLAGTKVTIFKSGDPDEDLRQRLLKESYTGQMPYPQYLGIPEGYLGRGCTGSDVMDLQLRLTDLGYFNGTVDGSYKSQLISAVKRIQGDMGVDKTGMVSPDLKAAIFSDSAPVTVGSTTLREGSSGPIVKKFQESLRNLKLYDGPIDGMYDLDVINAVKTFQQTNGYETNGVATPTIQKAVYYVEEQLEEMFGSLETMEISNDPEMVTYATVDAQKRVYVRAKPDTESSEVTKLDIGDTVLVVKYGENWCAVQTESGKKGYMKTQLLKGYQKENPIITYSSPDSSETYTMGYTMQQYMNGEKGFAAKFSAYLSKTEYEVQSDGSITYATVNTGSDDVALNLRAEASSEGAVVASLPNGTQMRTLTIGDEWSLVSYQGNTGYLMNEYLLFWDGDAEALITRMNVNTANVTTDQASVFQGDTEDATLLGHLPAGTKLTVVDAFEEDDWVLIELKGRQGYMLKQDLEFVEA